MSPIIDCSTVDTRPVTLSSGHWEFSVHLSFHFFSFLFFFRRRQPLLGYRQSYEVFLIYCAITDSPPSIGLRDSHLWVIHGLCPCEPRIIARCDGLARPFWSKVRIAIPSLKLAFCALSRRLPAATFTGNQLMSTLTYDKLHKPGCDLICGQVLEPGQNQIK
jgi:hypothetical protein